MERLILSIILLIISQLSFSQRYNPRVDSLLEKAEKAPIEKQAEAYNMVCQVLKYTEPQNAIQYSEKAIEIAQKYNNPLQLSIGYNYIGICYKKLGKLSLSMDYFFKGLTVSVENKMENQTAWCYRNMGNSFNYIGNYNKAIEYVQRAIEIGEKEKDDKIIAYCYNELGESYNGLKEFDKAKEYVFKSMKIKQENQMPKIQMGVGYVTLGHIYYNLEMYDSTNYYYQKCLELNELLDNDFLVGLYIDMAKLYYQKGYKDSTLLYCQKSSIIAKESYSRQFLGVADGIIGDLFYNEGNYEDAANHYISRMKLNDSIFGTNLPQKLFNIQYKSDRYEMQQQLESLNDDRKQQEIMIAIISMIILFGFGLSLIMIRNSRRIKSLNIKLNKQQQVISNAINYASNIQKSALPKDEELNDMNFESFILYKPRDIVSGNFYWKHEHENSDYEMFAVADCTGKRVHGACMNMLGMSILHEMADEYNDPSELLENSRRQMKQLLHQRDNATMHDEGMKIALIVFDKISRTIKYSGSYIPIYYFKNNKLGKIDGVESPIGISSNEKNFRTDTLKLDKGDMIYLSTDGIVSQIGGMIRKCYGERNFENLLKAIHKLPIKTQRQRIEDAFYSWKKKEQQSDDVCVIGLKIL